MNKDKCPMGENCDLTIAYMKGFEEGKERVVSREDAREALEFWLDPRHASVVERERRFNTIRKLLEQAAK